LPIRRREKECAACKGNRSISMAALLPARKLGSFHPGGERRRLAKRPSARLRKKKGGAPRREKYTLASPGKKNRPDRKSLPRGEKTLLLTPYRKKGSRRVHRRDGGWKGKETPAQRQRTRPSDICAKRAGKDLLGVSPQTGRRREEAGERPAGTLLGRKKGEERCLPRHYRKLRFF